MRANEREQREIIAALGWIVERERNGKGAHRVLYLAHPSGAKIVMTISCGSVSDNASRTTRNFKARLVRAIGEVK